MPDFTERDFMTEKDSDSNSDSRTKHGIVGGTDCVNRIRETLENDQDDE